MWTGWCVCFSGIGSSRRFWSQQWSKLNWLCQPIIGFRSLLQFSLLLTWHVIMCCLDRNSIDSIIESTQTNLTDLQISTNWLRDAIWGCHQRREIRKLVAYVFVYLVQVIIVIKYTGRVDKKTANATFTSQTHIQPQIDKDIYSINTTYICHTVVYEVILFLSISAFFQFVTMPWYEVCMSLSFERTSKNKSWILGQTSNLTCSLYWSLGKEVVCVW